MRIVAQNSSGGAWSCGLQRHTNAYEEGCGSILVRGCLQSWDAELITSSKIVHPTYANASSDEPSFSTQQCLEESSFGEGTLMATDAMRFREGKQADPEPSGLLDALEHTPSRITRLGYSNGLY